MKQLKRITVTCAMLILLSSCYSHRSIVGDGAQRNHKTTKWNHYLIGGLAPVGVADTKEMAKGEKNYEVHTRHTFVSGLVGFLTFGLYTPTVTTVIK